jgi:hypothetical protein
MMPQILCAYAHSESVQFSLERALNALFKPSEVKVGIELALDPKFECWEPFLRKVVRSWRSKPLDWLPGFWIAVPHRERCPSTFERPPVIQIEVGLPRPDYLGAGFSIARWYSKAPQVAADCRYCSLRRLQKR